MVRFSIPVVALIGFALAGCGSVGNEFTTPFVDPARYDYHDCRQLDASLTNYRETEERLARLMQAGSREAGGDVMVEIGYRPQMTQATSHRRLIERKRMEKGCAAPSVPSAQPIR